MSINSDTLSYYNRMLKPELKQFSNIVFGYGISALCLLKNKKMRVSPLHIIKLINEAYDEKAVGAHTRTSFYTDQTQINLISSANKMDKNKLLNLISLESNQPLIRSICDTINKSDLCELLSQCHAGEIDVEMNVLEIDVIINGILVKSFKVLCQESLPTGGIGKSELDNDYGYFVIRNFVKSIFNVDLGADSSVYFNEAHNLGNPTVQSVENAVCLAFKQAEQKIRQGLHGALDTYTYDFREDMLSSVLKFYCNVDFTSNYDYVSISEDMKCSSFDPNRVKLFLYHKKLHIYCPQSGNPSLRLSDDEGNDLFFIRFKKEAYPTNITGHRYKLFFVPAKIKEYLQ